MKRTALLAILLLVLLIPLQAPAQPTDVGEVVFRSNSTSLVDYLWTLRFTLMGNNHLAVHGEALPFGGLRILPPEDPPIVILGGDPEPVVGTAVYLSGSNTLRMILEKNGATSISIKATEDPFQFWKDSYTVEFSLITLAGDFKMIRHEYGTVTPRSDSHIFDSGSFTLSVGAE